MQNNNLLEYNWNEETGKILNLPNFTGISEFLLEYNTFEELKLRIKKFDINYDIEHIICQGFEKIVSHFKTKKSEITLNNFTYKLSEENSIFFWKNSLGKVFYIRPIQMISIYEYVLEYIYNGCFMDSLLIKEMSAEESDYYCDLVLKDEIKAENYRMKFFTSLQNDSNKEILEICNFKILQAFEDSFSLKISEINHNGDKNLKNEIIYFINNNKEFQSIVKLRT